MQILLIDDDILWRTQLQKMLDEIGLEDVAVCEDIHQAETYLSIHTPHLIISDILLGKNNVFDFLSNSKFTEIPILFITVSEDANFYDRARAFKNSSYLIKPFHAISLRATIDKMMLSNVIKPTDTSGITVRGIYHEKITIKPAQIVFVRSERNYCVIKTPNNQFALKRSLLNLSTELGNEMLQVHRSFLVNKSRIEKIDLRKMVLKTEGGELPIGNHYKDAVVHYMNEIREL